MFSNHKGSPGGGKGSKESMEMMSEQKREKKCCKNQRHGSPYWWEEFRWFIWKILF